MSTAEDLIAVELRQELEVRLAAWKPERERLSSAVARIAELDALIDSAEDNTRTSLPLAPRPGTVEPPAEVAR